MTTRPRSQANPFGLFGGGKPKPAPKARGHRAPSRREMEEQLRNAHKRAERAVDRLERAEYGTYAYEEAIRLAKLAQRHLERTEAKAFDEHGIEPGRQGGLARLLRRPAKERPRRTGLGELLFQEGERQRERRRPAPRAAAPTRATAKTRTYAPTGGRGRPDGRRAPLRGSAGVGAAAADQPEFDGLAGQAARGELRGAALADFINRFGRTKKEGRP